MPFIATTSSSSAWLQLKVCFPCTSFPLFPLLTLSPLLPRPTIGQLLGKVCCIRCSLSSFAFMVRTQYAKHSPFYSSSSSHRIPSSSSQCNHNFNYFSFMLIRPLSLPPPRPFRTPLLQAEHAERSCLHLVLLSQRLFGLFRFLYFRFIFCLFFFCFCFFIFSPAFC